jgi:hypothetical protein
VRRTIWLCWLALGVLGGILPPGSALAGRSEDVVYGLDGTVLRGELIDDSEECRERQSGAVCRVRIEGGSILTLPAEDVERITRQRRATRGTSHGGQLGVWVAGGIAGGFAVPKEPGIGEDDSLLLLTFRVPMMVALTYGITDSLEITMGYATIFGGQASNDWFHYATVGTRYYFNPFQVLKMYAGMQLLAGNGYGWRTRSGYQIDIGHHVGLFAETGWTFVFAGRETLALALSLVGGIQGRFF